MQKKLLGCLLALLSAALLLPGCKSNREHDHVFGAWKIVDASTCTKEGTRSRSCTVCGATETRAANLLPHDFNSDNICKTCNLTLSYTEQLEYTLSSDGNSYILSGRGENSPCDVVVPFYYQGKPVTEIAEDCFLASAITSISIQNSVKKIGARAFNSCDALENFHMYDSVEEVGNFAFASCTSLKSVRLSDNLTKVDELFYGCSSLAEVEIGQNVREITDLSFFGCSALTAVDLPESLERIGSMAFSESGIVSLGIPQKITELERGLFIGCPSLKRVTVFGNLTKISGDQFENCASFENLILYNVSQDDWKRVDKAVFWEGENCAEFTVIFRNGKLPLQEAKDREV